VYAVAWQSLVILRKLARKMAARCFWSGGARSVWLHLRSTGNREARCRNAWRLADHQWRSQRVSGRRWIIAAMSGRSQMRREQPTAAHFAVLFTPLAERHMILVDYQRSIRQICLSPYIDTALSLAFVGMTGTKADRCHCSNCAWKRYAIAPCRYSNSQ
jgi:hypothetical protein